MSQEFIPLSVPNFKGNEKEYVSDAVVSEWVSSGGAKVSEFEKVMAEYSGAAYGVACNSGTSGLHLALLVAGIQPGDEVVVPTLTFIAAVNPVRYASAQPVFLGCDDSLCIDPEGLEDFCKNHCELRGETLYNKTSGRPVKAVMVVHVFGNMANMERIMEISRQYHLTVIEDATEALGTRCLEGKYAGKMAGTIGDVGVYSFNGNKIITTGSGGMLVTDCEEWANRAKHLSTQAKSDELQYYHDEIGYNYRLTNLQAALGLAQMEQLEGFIQRKQEMYQLYKEGLDGKKGLRVLGFRDDIRSNRWFFSLLLDEYPMERDALIDALQKDRIQTRPIWGLIHQQPPYQECQAFHTEKAEYYRDRIVNLPCGTALTDAQVQRVIDTILSYV